MAKGVVLDTNIVSHMWRKSLPTSVAQILSGKLYVSFVTIGEIWQGIAEAPHWSDEEAARLAKFLHRFKVIEGDTAVAEQWGNLAGEAKRKGRRLPVNDSWIAACCLARNLPLVTLDRVFERIPQLKLQYEPDK